jgi:hypothetical protein
MTKPRGCGTPIAAVARTDAIDLRIDNGVVNLLNQQAVGDTFLMLALSALTGSANLLGTLRQAGMAISTAA